jgi:DNA transformation protein and related proteins
VADSFVAHVIECMRGFGAVEATRMFGGWGLYREDVFFALVLDDTLYLKTDEGNRAEFDARALEPFSFVKGGKTIVTAYRAAPEEAFEDAAVMAKWAKGAYAAALRKAKGGSPSADGASHSTKGKGGRMSTIASSNVKDGAHCTVVAGTHKGKSGTVRDLNTSKGGNVTITVVQANGERFKTLAKNVEMKP